MWYCAADSTGTAGSATIAGSGVVNQVSFFSGSTSISGSNNLWWDNSNTRLGIGTSGPLTALDVSGTTWLRGLSANSGLFVNTSGYVGIGTTNPTAPLSVGTGSAFAVSSTGAVTSGSWNGAAISVPYGGTGLTSIAAGSVLAANSVDTLSVITSTSGLKVLQNSAGTTSWATTTGTGNVVFSDSPVLTTQAMVPLIVGGSSPTSVLTLKSTSGTGTTDAIVFQVGTNGGTEAMRILNSGNIGIGTTSNAYKLFVDGSLNATSLYLSGSQVTSSATELNILDGATLSTTELNLLTGRSGTLLDSGNVGTYATTAVTAGSGLSGGGTTGALTINIGGGNGITINADDITIDATTAGTTTVKSNNSGLEVVSDGLRLLGGCANGEVLKWNSSTSVWYCAVDTTGSGTATIAGSGIAGQLTFFTGSTAVSGSNNLWWDNTGGNLGIGTSGPVAKLELAGSADTEQFVIKANATQSNTQPLIQLQSPTGTPLLSITSDNETNAFFGYRAGSANTYGSATSGGGNTFIGYLSGSSNNAGYQNTSVGGEALSRNTTGVYNSGLGYQSLYSNTTANYNTAVGFQALYSNTLGSANIGVGFGAGVYNQTGTGNLFLGHKAGYGGAARTGSDFNAAVGYEAGYSLSANSDSNIFLGYRAGYNETGSNNLYIDNTSSPADTAFIYGDMGLDRLTFNANVGIGKTSPTAWLDVAAATTAKPSIRVATGAEPSSPVTGDIYNNGTSLYYYNGTAWKDLTATGAGGGLAGSGIAGQLTFFTGSTAVSGSNNLWWDSGNSRLGIGTSAPLTSIDVSGTTWLRGLSANSGLFVNQSGYTGIGTTSPISKLQVEGPTWLRGGTGVAGAKGVYIDANSNLGIGTTNPGYLLTLNTTTDQHAIAFLEGTTNRAFFGLAASAGQFAAGSRDNDLIWRSESGSNQLWTTDGGTTAMVTLNSGGNLGIGTTAPLAWFDVKGATTSEASIRVRSGTQPSAPATGDIYNDGDQLFFYNGTAWQDLGATTAGGGGIAGSGIAGQLTFFTGSTAVSGSNNLFWDTSNSRLGIGTSAPASQLALLSTDTTNGQFRIGYDASNYTKFTTDSVGNLTLNNNGTNVVKFGATNTEFYTPTTFSAAGDVSMAYDLIFTNATSSELRSYGPLSITAGETYGSSNLTLKTYNSGDIVADLTGTGRLRLNGADTTLLFDTKTATDTDYWMGVIDDAGGDDDDMFAIGKGLSNSSNIYLSIASSGWVGLGLPATSAPTATLDVNGGARFRGIGSSAYVGAVNYATGGVLTTATSDARLKTNVTTIDNALDKVTRLRGVTFNWLDPNAPKRMTGMIAQEVADVMPELVFQNPNDGYYGLFYGETTGLLIEATKELNTKLLALESGLTTYTTTADGTLSTITTSTDSNLTKLNTLETDVTALQTEVLSIKELLAQAAPQSSQSSATVATTPEGMLAEMYKVFEDLKAFVAALGLSNNGNALAVSTDLNVLGDTTLSNLTVTGDISAGLMKLDTLNNVFEVAGPSCYNELTGTTNTTLCTDQTMYLQKSLAGNVDVLNGALVVEPNGNVTVKGTLLAQKVETTDISTENVTIKAASKSVGSGTITSGQTQIVIDNTLIKTGSKVFVTATSSTNGQALIVKEKLDGVSFTVAVDRPVPGDVAFDWWIVNVE
ncbi:MAG: hypothetical protein UW67_C0004G0003 [candidate division WWE3 bacterium GW2011_GWE1_44_51]|nr:MAG: hypothetical protein UW67_C0004G0003 [candidate division WWE3 bacterium GW2011_GWE1_44_51]